MEMEIKMDYNGFTLVWDDYHCEFKIFDPDGNLRVGRPRISEGKEWIDKLIDKEKKGKFEKVAVIAIVKDKIIKGNVTSRDGDEYWVVYEDGDRQKLGKVSYRANAILDTETNRKLLAEHIELARQIVVIEAKQAEILKSLERYK